MSRRRVVSLLQIRSMRGPLRRLGTCRDGSDAVAPLSVRCMMIYLSPDTIMPLASAFAAVVGVVVMFWQKVKAFVRGIVAKLRRAPQKDA